MTQGTDGSRKKPLVWHAAVKRAFERPMIRNTMAIACSFVIALLATSGARGAEPMVDTTAQAIAPESITESHPNPRLKLSYRQFSINNLDESSIPLRGVELNAYPLSRRWVRAGLELEGGVGQASLSGVPFNVRYGLMGGTAAFQYPARITPFVEGRIVAGIMGANLDHEVTVPGTTVILGPTSVATWVYGRGIDVGAELFTVGRAYVSASVGWLHTTWRGVDYAAIMQNPQAAIRLKDLNGDSFTFKLGVGI